MIGDGVLTIRTGPGGSGKSYWAVKWLFEELLPYYKEAKVLTNLPVLTSDSRVTVREFESGWCPKHEDVEGCWVIVDEAHKCFSRDNDKAFRAILGEARHYGTKWVLLSQSKDKLPGWVDEEAEIWFESANGRVLRDQTFGLRIYDLQNVWAKLTGHFREFFKLTEYVRANRRWKAIQTYNSWFDDRIGKLYNTHNRQGATDTGEAVVIHDYQRFGWVTLLRLVAMRNMHVVPSLLLKWGLPVGMMTAGTMWLFYSLGTAKPSQPVLTKPPVSGSHLQKPLPTQAQTQTPKEIAKPKVAKRVITWLCVLGLLGCRAPSATMPRAKNRTPSHLEKIAPLPEPHVAIEGAGHSLSEVLAEAGIKSSIDAQVDGPLVGSEIIEAAMRLGHELHGDRMVPSPKRWVRVPDEIAEVEQVVTVGGQRLVAATPGQLHEWQMLGAIVHESYVIDLIICTTRKAASKQLGLVAGAQSGLEISYPDTLWKPTGKVSLRAAADGNWVDLQEVARPALQAQHGVTASVHVGSKVPVRLTQSSTTQTASTIGSTLTFIDTGLQIQVKPERVSRRQVKLSGNCSVSEQTATVDGAPVTSEREVSIEHVIPLDESRIIARLDTGRDDRSGAWYGLGGLTASKQETFVVIARVGLIDSAKPMSKDTPPPSRPKKSNDSKNENWDLSEK